MSLWSSLVAATALPLDLATGGTGLGIVAAASQVYAGRRPSEHCNRLGEVWLEELPGSRVGSGLQMVDVLPVNVHVRYPRNPGPTRSGVNQLTEVEAKLETIQRAYHGKRRMIAIAGLTDVIAIEAVIVEVDDDPEVPDALDGVVRLTFFSKE